jgi:hypothetical protein
MGGWIDGAAEAAPFQNLTFTTGLSGQALEHPANNPRTR